jgi:hypothetical protein
VTNTTIQNIEKTFEKQKRWLKTKRAQLKKRKDDRITQ